MIRYLDAGSDDFGTGGNSLTGQGEGTGGIRGRSGGRSPFGFPGPSRPTSVSNGGTSLPSPIRVVPTTPTPSPTIITPAPAPVIDDGLVRGGMTILPPAPPAPIVETPIRVAAPSAPMMAGEVSTVRDNTIPRPIPISEAQIADEINIKANTLANEMIKIKNTQTVVAASGRVFTRFDYASDVIENQKVIVTTGLFSNNAATMSVMYTGSAQSSTSKQYYYDAWNGIDSTSESQFSVAYGHRLGSGSYGGGGSLNDAPSRAVYSQYRLLLLDPGDTTFTFNDGRSTNSIYAINFNRARLKDKLDPGNWQVELAQLSGSSVVNNVHTGSNVRLADNPGVISLMDDSGDTFQTKVTTAGRVYNVVSGSISNGVYNSSAPHYYGLVYPDMGMIILNGDALNTSASFNTVTGSGVAGDNAWKLFTSISGAMSIDDVGNAFQARNSETVTSTHFFVRVKNGEYNFSNNPSFTTGSVGEFSQPTFIGDPKTYITTVGMYNDRQELLAVAKLSQPVQKSFSNESLIKVKLDF